MATVLWEIQMCAVPSHPMGCFSSLVSHGIPIGITFLWTSLPMHVTLSVKYPLTFYRGSRGTETIQSKFSQTKKLVNSLRPKNWSPCLGRNGKFKYSFSCLFLCISSLVPFIFCITWICVRIIIVTFARSYFIKQIWKTKSLLHMFHLQKWTDPELNLRHILKLPDFSF